MAKASQGGTSKGSAKTTKAWTRKLDGSCVLEKDDHITDGNLALSGWIAIYFGNNLLETRLQEGSNMKASDMYYMRIVEANGQASILLHKSDGQEESTIYSNR